MDEELDIFEYFGIPVVINACGTNTRLSNGIMAPEVARAMAAASFACVNLVDLQAASSRVISDITGAEAGIVTCGASAAVLLGAAACMAGLDPAAMNQLPDADGLRHEFIVIRSQRNMYDRAIRVAGGTVKEIGIPDRYSGTGVRDVLPWEIEAALSERTTAIYYLAQPQSLPPLGAIVEVARAAQIPVIVDAAAQLPPAENLRRFIAEGADLVAISGGKALGGPPASGLLFGREKLISSALIQMIDLDLAPEQWTCTGEFRSLSQMRGLPHHGVGRSCKVGKQEVIGLLMALRMFVAESSETRTDRWVSRLEAVLAALPAGADYRAEIVPSGSKPGLPLLKLQFPSSERAAEVDGKLRVHLPPVHLDASRVRQGVLAVNPIALRDEDVPQLCGAISATCS
ncbi:hypothetical protein [Mesorhizobium caraganae]|uniref:hypothetical protein n=1 Tax=Mesorhizobium caraganae TaxID=483206 RepID=UPI001785A1E7|nr:hypothetical protein [Mesorhizobium caraganae]